MDRCYGQVRPTRQGVPLESLLCRLHVAMERAIPLVLPQAGRLLLCVDAAVLQGRLYHPYLGTRCYCVWMQLRPAATPVSPLPRDEVLLLSMRLRDWCRYCKTGLLSAGGNVAGAMGHVS